MRINVHLRNRIAQMDAAVIGVGYCFWGKEAVQEYCFLGGEAIQGYWFERKSQAWEQNITTDRMDEPDLRGLDKTIRSIL
jgi:hypothetical protein